MKTLLALLSITVSVSAFSQTSVDPIVKNKRNTEETKPTKNQNDEGIVESDETQNQNLDFKPSIEAGFTIPQGYDGIMIEVTAANQFQQYSLTVKRWLVIGKLIVSDQTGNVPYADLRIIPYSSEIENDNFKLGTYSKLAYRYLRDTQAGLNHSISISAFGISGAIQTPVKGEKIKAFAELAVGLFGLNYSALDGDKNFLGTQIVDFQTGFGFVWNINEDTNLKVTILGIDGWSGYGAKFNDGQGISLNSLTTALYTKIYTRIALQINKAIQFYYQIERNTMHRSGAYDRHMFGVSLKI